MTPEKKFENKLIKELNRQGIFAHHVDMVGCDGFPDIICLCKNRSLLIECKWGTDHVRATQAAFYQKLQNQNGFGGVIIAWGFDSRRYFWSSWGGFSRSSLNISEMAAQIKEEWFGEY